MKVDMEKLIEHWTFDHEPSGLRTENVELEDARRQAPATIIEDLPEPEVPDEVVAMRAAVELPRPDPRPRLAYYEPPQTVSEKTDILILKGEIVHEDGPAGEFQLTYDEPSGKLGTYIEIAEEYRKQGFGKEWVKRMEESARDLGLDRVVHRPTNEGSVAAGLGLGFEPGVEQVRRLT